MTRDKLTELLKSTGFDVAFYSFSAPPKPPYIAYTLTENHSGSDFENLIVETSYHVELYVDVNNLAAEKKLDNLLNFASFHKTITFIAQTELFLVSYDFEIITKS